MLTPVTAIRFDKEMGSGRTKPCLLACEDKDGKEVNLVVKFVAGCDRREKALLTEAIVAVLAADLGLPVPEPFLVRVEPDFAGTITNAGARSRAQESLGWNFGSQKLPSGFAAYPKGFPLQSELFATAVEIFAFDTFIVNDDRRVDNPNLLVKGKELAIIDHELALFIEGIIDWKPPWEPDPSRFPLIRPIGECHVFLKEIRGKQINLTRFVKAFQAISMERFEEYRQNLPAEWVGDGVAVDKILCYIGELKENIEKAIETLEGALR